MTAQNVIFLAVIVAVALVCLFQLNFILNHTGVVMGLVAAVLAALYYFTRNGTIDWDEWIPKGRE